MFSPLAALLSRVGTAAGELGVRQAEGHAAVAALTDDPRYDAVRWFETASAVRLPEACARMTALFGRRYGLPEFEIDCEPDEDAVWVWTEARAEAVGVYVTVRDRFLTPAEQAAGVWPSNPNPYRIQLRWSSRLVGPDEERAVLAALAEAFGGELVQVVPR